MEDSHSRDLKVHVQKLVAAADSVIRLGRVPIDQRACVKKACRHLVFAMQHLKTVASDADPALGTLQASVPRIAQQQLSSIKSEAKTAKKPTRWQPKKAPATLKPVKPIEEEDDGVGGLRGDTSTVALTDLINLLGFQEKTGTLIVTTDSEKVFMVFDAGLLIHAASNNCPPGKRLGELVVKQGFITEEAFQQFLTDYTNSPVNRIGTALVAEELVTTEQLTQALELQIQDLFNRLLLATKATFVFCEKASAESDQRIKLNVQQLILESARQNDESAATPDRAGD